MKGKNKKEEKPAEFVRKKRKGYFVQPEIDKGKTLAELRDALFEFDEHPIQEMGKIRFLLSEIIDRLERGGIQ